MRINVKKLVSFCTLGITICCLILFAVLSVSALLVTTYTDTAYTVHILMKWNNPLLHLLFLIIYVLFAYYFGRLYQRLTKNTIPLLITVCLWVFCFSLAGSYFFKTGPSADCASVYYTAKLTAENNFSHISGYGSYYSCYPFQLGLNLFYEIIFRISPSNDFHILQGVNAILLVATVLSQYLLLDTLFRSVKSKIYYLLLVATCFPFMMYGSYVYGDIPSIAFLSLGGSLLVLFFRDFKPLPGLAALFFTICGMIVRKNSLIFLIAAAIVMVLFFLQHVREFSVKKNVFLFLYIAVFIALSYNALPWVIRFYEYRSGAELNAGVPPSTYFAMGLMESETGPGHYNAFNFLTFTEAADYDDRLASALGWAAYRERLSFFFDNPGYAVRFLTGKFLSQWTNAGWAAFNYLCTEFGKKIPLIESCFSGPLYYKLLAYFSKYQLMLYLSAFSFFIRTFRNRRQKKINLMMLLFPLTAVGGALFSIIWEASGRYILPYCIFTLPFAALGLQYITEVIFKNDH